MKKRIMIQIICIYLCTYTHQTCTRLGGLLKNRTASRQETANMQSLLDTIGAENSIQAHKTIDGIHELLDTLQADSVQQAHGRIHALFNELEDIKTLLHEYVHSSGIIRNNKKDIFKKNPEFDSSSDTFENLLYALEANDPTQAHENLQALFAHIQEIKLALQAESLEDAISKIKELQSLGQQISNLHWK